MMRKLLLFFLPVLLWAQTTTPGMSLTKPGASSVGWGTAVNTNFDIIDKATVHSWGQSHATTAGLVFGFYGGPAFNGTTWVTVADGTVTLAASNTSYVERTDAGAVSANTSGWTAGRIPLAKVITGSSSITTVSDFRGSSGSGPLFVSGNYLGNRGEPDSTAYGFRSLEAVNFSGADPSGRYNTSYGAWTLYQLTTGYKDAAFGRASSDNITTAAKCASFGYGSLHWHVSGDEITALGHEALHDNVSGTASTASGSFCFWKSLGSWNTGSGKDCGSQLVNGDHNTLSGNSCASSLGTGSYNAIFGDRGFANATAMTNSVGLGYNVGATNLTGSYITLVGDQSNVSSDGLSYATAVGAGSAVATSDTVSLGRATGNVYCPNTLTAANTVTSPGFSITGASGLVQNSGVSGAGTVNGLKLYASGDVYMGTKAATEFRLYNGSTLEIQSNDVRTAINQATASTSTATGALQVANGGVGIAGDLYVGASVNGQTVRITGKAFTANGSTTTFTYPASKSYQYITTSAASLATTLPATGASVDGLVIVYVAGSAVGTATWVAGTGGATIVGAPAALSANVPVRLIYHHATTSWYPF